MVAEAMGRAAKGIRVASRTEDGRKIAAGSSGTLRTHDWRPRGARTGAAGWRRRADCGDGCGAGPLPRRPSLDPEALRRHAARWVLRPEAQK